MATYIFSNEKCKSHQQQEIQRKSVSELKTTRKSKKSSKRNQKTGKQKMKINKKAWMRWKNKKKI